MSQDFTEQGFFESLIGHGYTYDFYGVSDTTFCIGVEGRKIAFEAIEDPDDGYRSYLKTIKIVMPEDNVFFKIPIAKILIEKSDVNNLVGWQFVDAESGHIWLKVGTDHADDWYPSFIFLYDPKQP